MRRGWVPYRGDGLPYKKPLKRVVNLKSLRRLLARDILVILVPLTIATIYLLRAAPDKNEAVFILTLIWISALVIVAGIIDLNKFQKGRDIDTSNWEEKEDNEHKEENDD